jgi:hypothetical protein
VFAHRMSITQRGFAIVCKDGEVVVSDSESIEIYKMSDHLHNSVEPRIHAFNGLAVQKTEWTVKVASCVKRFLTCKSVVVPIEEAFGFALALDQLRVPNYRVRLPEFITGESYLQAKDLVRAQNIMDDGVKIPWTIDAFSVMKVEDWRQYLMDGIYVFDDFRADYIFEATRTKHNDELYRGDFQQWQTREPDRLFASDFYLSTKSYMHIHYSFGAYSSIPGLTEEGFAMSLAKQIFPRCKLSGDPYYNVCNGDVRVLTADFPLLRKVSASNESLSSLLDCDCLIDGNQYTKYFLNDSEGHLTLSGTFSQLHTALCRLQEDAVKTDDKQVSHTVQNIIGSLRVAAYSLNGFLRAILACRMCVTHPKTLGVETETDSIFAIKTIDDLILMTEYLAREANVPEDTPPGELSLIRLSQPMGAV